VRPIELGPNQPRQFYRGGASIAELRGTSSQDAFRPEDWVASTTSRFGLGDDGQTVLPDGQLLRDTVGADPEAWLGPAHVAYFGTSTGVLVKLLEAGQRLPVHVHPDRAFAYRHLGSRHGKTEAWVILGTAGPEPTVYLGWSRDVEYHEMYKWVEEQDSAAMLANMHKLTVSPGHSVLVPAGTAHAIGEGVFCAELQEPTDFSIMLEFAGFDMDRGAGDLGLGREVALSCVKEKAFTADDLERLQLRTGPSAPGPVPGDALLPVAAKPYFWAEKLDSHRQAPAPASFAVLIGTRGDGQLRGPGWEMPARRGSTIVVPWSAGPTTVNGDVELIRCLPPQPGDAASDDPSSSKDNS
jgi:mannose-6-phosphate isomerase